jgi:hypothetical protein
MLVILGALAIGIVVGLLGGGSLRRLAEVQLRWWPLAIAGLGLQLIPVPSLPGRLDHWLAVGLLVASYLVLLGFVWANLRLPGFALMAVGFALNMLVISINGGMPVSDRALREAYGGGYRATLRDLTRHGGAKHHLERPDDVLTPLADVIPIGSPVRKVFSLGDLVALAGMAWVVGAATQGPSGRHRKRQWGGSLTGLRRALVAGGSQPTGGRGEGSTEIRSEPAGGPGAGDRDVRASVEAGAPPAAAEPKARGDLSVDLPEPVRSADQ